MDFSDFEARTGSRGSEKCCLTDPFLVMTFQRDSKWTFPIVQRGQATGVLKTMFARLLACEEVPENL